MLKNKIFKYFFLEYLRIFLLVIFSLSVLIWMTQAARLLELITEYGNSISIYAKYLLLSFPKIAERVFLLSFAIATFFVINKFENSNELSIYWLSGIGKEQLIKILLYIAFFLMLINLILSSIIVPWTLSKGREVLSKSKFTLINTLVKENNFNSPLKGLTIYVDSNDQNGNLKGIFIYENNRSIVAEYGKVLVENDRSFLKLFNGKTFEKSDNKINSIYFENTIFDFSEYQLQNTIVPKFTERSTFWLIKNINLEIKKLNEIREELNTRLIKPFYILILCLIGCFLFYNNNEKIKINKLKSIVYIGSILIIISNQALLGFSGKKIIYGILYFAFTIISFVSLYLFLLKIINSESVK